MPELYRVWCQSYWMHHQSLFQKSSLFDSSVCRNPKIILVDLEETNLFKSLAEEALSLRLFVLSSNCQAQGPTQGPTQGRVKVKVLVHGQDMVRSCSGQVKL